MSKIETLTEHERRWVGQSVLGQKALRIIDAQAEELAALRHIACSFTACQVVAVESRLAAASYWVEKWRAEENHQDSGDWYMSKVDKAIAAQTAAPTSPAHIGPAIIRCFACGSTDPIAMHHCQPAAPALYATAAQSTSELMARVHAAAPARTDCVGCTKHTIWDDCPVHAAPARTEAEHVEHSCPSCGDAIVLPRVTRAEAEQAVLDASAAMSLNDDDPDGDPLEPQEHGEDCYICTDDQYTIAKAELARRHAGG